MGAAAAAAGGSRSSCAATSLTGCGRLSELPAQQPGFTCRRQQLRPAARRPPGDRLLQPAAAQRGSCTGCCRRRPAAWCAWAGWQHLRQPASVLAAARSSGSHPCELVSQHTTRGGGIATAPAQRPARAPCRHSSRCSWHQPSCAPAAAHIPVGRPRPCSCACCAQQWRCWHVSHHSSSSSAS